MFGKITSAGGDGGRYGSIGESSSSTPGGVGVSMEGPLGMTINSSNSMSNSSSSSSRSSVLVEEQDDCGFMTHDVYQRQPLLQEKDSYTKDYEERMYKENCNSYYNGSSNGIVKIPMPTPHREEPRFPKEKMKTFLAFVFLFGNWLFTTASLALTHERVPNAPPLPDIVLDNINTQAWGLEVSEIMIIVSVYVCILVVIFHKYRLIIFRRIFLIMGLLYFYRSITMYVTVLPVADPNYYCSEKANNTNSVLVLKRMVRLLSGFGLSINGQHTFCGDYIYSGHTVCLVMAYLIIREYTPRRWWPLHWMFALLAAVGVVMVLIARGHYTVDCLIAYYITTRIFYIYHTLAHNQNLKDNGSNNNFFERLWWYPMFQYFERNVQGVVPRHYEWPLPWPRRWSSKNPQRTS